MHIPLTQGKVALVSDEDYDYLLSFGSWCYSTSGYAVHYGRNDEGIRTTISQHRLVMARAQGHPVPAELQVDHIDRDRLNNTRHNLRLATRSQNQANKNPQINTSYYKGVSAEGHRFRARIRFDRRQQLHLGQYDDPVDAARVYDASSRLLNQDFAGVNFPDKATTPELLAVVMHFVERNPQALAYLARRAGESALT